LISLLARNERNFAIRTFILTFANFMPSIYLLLAQLGFYRVLIIVDNWKGNPVGIVFVLFMLFIF